MAELLEHPLFGILVGALLTAWLFPWLVSRGQERQKELELKTEIVSELSEIIMKMVVAIQSVRATRDQLSNTIHTRHDLDTLVLDLDKHFDVWEVEAAVMATKLHTYFPKDFPEDVSQSNTWDQFREIIACAYELERLQDEQIGPKEKSRAQEGLARQLGPGAKVGEGWEGVKAEIFQKKRDLIQKVLSSEVTELRSQRSTPWGVPVKR